MWIQGTIRQTYLGPPLPKRHRGPRAASAPRPHTAAALHLAARTPGACAFISRRACEEYGALENLDGGNRYLSTTEIVFWQLVVLANAAPQARIPLHTG